MVLRGSQNPGEYRDSSEDLFPSMTDTFQEREFARAKVNITNAAGMGGAPTGGLF